MYDGGLRVPAPLFTAFCLHNGDGERPPGARFGVTVPRAVGNAVIRNRIKRRVREALRLTASAADSRWDIVINPRRRAADAPFEALRNEIRRLVERCGTLS